MDRKDSERHKDILLQIHDRDEGWKLKCLSRTCRITLAQSVLAAIPIFYMQLERLPTWVHREIDNAVRKCVWGSFNGGRGFICCAGRRCASLRRLVE